jgi:hypothetical protein
MQNTNGYFTGKHPPILGASWLEKIRGELKQGLGRFLNVLRFPGLVKPLEIHDTLTGTYIQVRVSGFFTVISIDGRDFYFKRLTGKYDGSGMSVTSRMG